MGTCDGRALEWSIEDYSKGGAYRLQLVETNRKLVCRVHMVTMEKGQILIWERLKSQEQMDEMVVVAGSFMQRYRIKLWKDGKFPVPWDKLVKVSKYENAALGAVSGVTCATGT